MTEKAKSPTTIAFQKLIEMLTASCANVVDAFVEFNIDGVRVRLDVDADTRKSYPATQEQAQAFADAMSKHVAGHAKAIARAEEVEPGQVLSSALAREASAQARESSVTKSQLAGMFAAMTGGAAPAPQALQGPAAINPECAPATDEEIAAMARASRASGTGSPPMTVPPR